MDKTDEKLLIQRAKEGDREALSTLWDSITPKLFGYLVNTTRDRFLAEDILQSTWIKAIEALPNFVPRNAGFSSWIFTIAHNECRQYWRKTNREIPFDPERHDQPDTNAESPDAKILIDQALNILSDDDRELIRLRYIADLPLNSIAEILNLNFVTVRVRIHRALAKMRATLSTQ